MLRTLSFLLLLSAGLFSQNGKPDGFAIYQKHCVSCHGEKGEGVVEEYDEALVGKRSISSLAKYIHRTMPEDEEDLVVDDDALAVAEYIHGAFYSPEAQERLKPVRKSLLRLTQHQHRNAIADVVASFSWRRTDPGNRGLKAVYHSFREGKDNRKKEKILERIEEQAGFDLATTEPIENLNPKEFEITWLGSLMPPESGRYQFRLKTPNGARLFLNEVRREEGILIDGWVSSGNEMRELTGEAELLGGYPVSIKIDYLSFQEKVSSLVVEWKPPHGTWETIPTRHLWPETAPTMTIVTTSFPADDASLGYERGSSVSKAWQDATANSAMETIALLEPYLDGLSKSKPKQAKRAEKLAAFCRTFAKRAFARPLSPEQQERYADQFFVEFDPEEATRRSLLLILSSPYFLYPELGSQEDSYQVARRLALALWDSVPDNHLWKAAEKDELKEEWQLENQAKRMLQDPRAKQKVGRFFHHWLALSEREDLRKDSEMFPGFDEELIADLRVSLDLFLNEVIWSQNSDYRQLFTSPDLYLNSRLAEFYGSPKRPAQFERLPAPDKKRAGVFTHPYLLAAFSYNKQTSPIHRGVYLGRNVLGRYLKPPPEAIEFKDADFDPTLTMREKVTQLTKDVSCMSCHEIINPVGFSLEQFDAVGRFREKENNKPIDTKSIYPTPDDQEIPIGGPQDLARIAIQSSDAHRAFIQHLFHHLVQQPVAAYGSEAMDELHHQFVQNEFNIQKLINHIAKLSARPAPQN